MCRNIGWQEVTCTIKWTTKKIWFLRRPTNQQFQDNNNNTNKIIGSTVCVYLCYLLCSFLRMNEWMHHFFVMTFFLSNILYFYFSHRTKKALSFSFYTFESDFISFFFSLWLLHNVPYHMSHDLHYIQATTHKHTRT